MAKEIEFIFALRKLADAREENVVKLYVDEANLFLNTLSYYIEMGQEKAKGIDCTDKQIESNIHIHECFDEMNAINQYKQVFDFNYIFFRNPWEDGIRIVHAILEIDTARQLLCKREVAEMVYTGVQ